MRYLAIDYGRRRIGLAVCDKDELLASPFATKEHDSTKKSAARLLADLLETVRAQQIEGIVLGLPRGANGEESEMERATRAFASSLQNALRTAHCTVEIEWWDERFSTAQVLTALRHAGISQKSARQAGGASSIDARSAAVILQDFLDAKKQRTSHTRNGF
jgi:putative Holliday junction resolvase